MPLAYSRTEAARELGISARKLDALRRKGFETWHFHDLRHGADNPRYWVYRSG